MAEASSAPVSVEVGADVIPSVVEAPVVVASEGEALTFCLMGGMRSPVEIMSFNEN